jgi:hypothetical protein
MNIPILCPDVIQNEKKAKLRLRARQILKKSSLIFSLPSHQKRDGDKYIQ